MYFIRFSIFSIKSYACAKDRESSNTILRKKVILNKAFKEINAIYIIAIKEQKMEKNQNNIL